MDALVLYAKVVHGVSVFKAGVKQPETLDVLWEAIVIVAVQHAIVAPEDHMNQEHLLDY